MRDTLRVGIIGLGWGSMVHAPAFRSAGGYELMALCGRDPGRLQAVGERWGIADLSTDWQDFVKRPDLDVISIATPVQMHRPMVEAAFAAGKHLICEKPAGLDAREVEEMHCLAAHSGSRHAVALELRWLPEHLALAQLAGGGQLGQPCWCSSARMSGCGTRLPPRFLPGSCASTKAAGF